MSAQAESAQSDPASTARKALALNLDPSCYGTFAEIGAGQEVADWFFRVGGSSGTVAKSMSAYDMVMSDAIYGKTSRYVSQERLTGMLDHEWDILQERLGPVRGADTRFFAFADTIKARGYRDSGECHGWMGARFQTRPDSPPNDIVLHVRLFDPEASLQREVIGVLGVNFLHAIRIGGTAPEQLMPQLLDGITRRRMEIDFLRYHGPDFADIDNRMCALMLVELGLADAAMLTAGGEIVQAADHLHRRPLVLLRGDFRPPTKVHLDMIERTAEALAPDIDRPPARLAEISMHNLLHHAGGIDKSDFLARAEMLQALGLDVMVSGFSEFHRIAAYLAPACRAPIGIVVGLPLLETLFEETWYAGLEGGLLEGFGRLIREGVTVFVYPCANPDGSIRPLDQARVPDKARHLLDHLLANHRVRAIPCGVPDALPFTPPIIRQMILKGDPRWRDLVPETLETSLVTR